MSTSTLPNRTAIRKMTKPDLLAFASSHCLIEHLAPAAAAELSKPELLDEVFAAMLVIEVQNDREAFATDTVSKSVAETLGYTSAEPEAAPAGPKERRNETRHPDGAAAVEAFACPTCKARKAAQCIRHDGERTPYVHATRMAKYDATVTA